MRAQNSSGAGIGTHPRKIGLELAEEKAFQISKAVHDALWEISRLSNTPLSLVG